MADPAALRLHLRVPKPITKKKLKRGRPPGRIAQYDSDIVDLNNAGHQATKIAELIRREHDLDPMFMNRKSVERRLRTIRANGLAKLAPVNEDSDLVARDTPKRCDTFLFSLEILLFTFFLGQNSAITLGEGLTQEEDLLGDEKSDVEDNVNSDTAVTLAHFKDAGFLYTQEGEKNWVIFIARNMNSNIRLTEVQPNGIILTWSATPPSDESIIAVQQITSMVAREMNFQRSRCNVFVSSPRPLSMDSSKIKKSLTPLPPATAEWLVLSIPFEDPDEDMGIELTPLKPNDPKERVISM